MAQQVNSEWVARRRLAEASRALLFAVPVSVGLAAALGTRRQLNSQGLVDSWPVTAVVSLAVAVGAVAVLERAVHRLFPLNMLLYLAMLFPDQVPNQRALTTRHTSPKRLRGAKERKDVDASEAAFNAVELVRALTQHDRLTRGHSERVRAVTMMIAKQMNIGGAERDRLEWGALLHDVGKIEVSPLILNKPGEPDEEEWIELSHHPAQGVTLAADVADWLGDSIHAIDQHHERFDGHGYPDGLQGEQISQAARIVAVADAYDVMTAVRPYKTAMSPTQARRELSACSGSQFDPAVVRAFASVSVVRFNRFLGLGAWLVAMLF